MNRVAISAITPFGVISEEVSRLEAPQTVLDFAELGAEWIRVEYLDEKADA